MFIGSETELWMIQNSILNRKMRKVSESNKMTGRELHQKVTLIAALGGAAIPQNNRHTNGNDPLPDDIRANKKEGDEYDTIGDVLKKGGVRKVIVIAVAVLLAGYLLIKGLYGWLLLGDSTIHILPNLFS